MGLPAVAPQERKRRLQRLVRAYILAGLAFMLLPGTFLGVWNLIALSADRSHHPLSPAWVQAHGHTQIFGWIGSFVIGIGFFSLSRMGQVLEGAVKRGWVAWTLWTLGVTGRWVAGVYGWYWRWLLPLSAVLECCGYLMFFIVVRQHQPKPKGDLPILQKRPEAWMRLVVASTIAFLATLGWHAGVAITVAVSGKGPQFPRWADQILLTTAAWGFLALTVWAFNARWLAMFAGFRDVHERRLIWALRLVIAGISVALLGLPIVATVLILLASLVAAWSLHVFEPIVDRTKAQGVYASLPVFIRVSYTWLLVAPALALWASGQDKNGGIVGASRHALTVGFVATMVFAVGQRILPAFCGGFVLFSRHLMTAAISCFLRVISEVPAYEFHVARAWTLLPVSAVLELTAVALFAANLLLSFARRQSTQHVVSQRAAA